MNKKRKWVLAIAAPIIVFLFVIEICRIIPYEGKDLSGKAIIYYGINPFILEKSWFFWLIGLIVVGALEYILLKGKNSKNKDNKIISDKP